MTHILTSPDACDLNGSMRCAWRNGRSQAFLISAPWTLALRPRRREGAFRIGTSPTGPSGDLHYTLYLYVCICTRNIVIAIYVNPKTLSRLSRDQVYTFRLISIERMMKRKRNEIVGRTSSRALNRTARGNCD